MLTKQEREEIAERVKNYTMASPSIYECLLGSPLPKSTDTLQGCQAMAARILELCDTSNMIELPIDKDGEVIRVGDTVHIGDGIKYEVAGYMMRGNSTEVILAAGAEPVYTKEPANDITHKKPVTIASLVERIRDILDDDNNMTAWVFSELSHVAEQLEKLGDSDD